MTPQERLAIEEVAQMYANNGCVEHRSVPLANRGFDTDWSRVAGSNGPVCRHGQDTAPSPTASTPPAIEAAGRRGGRERYGSIAGVARRAGSRPRPRRDRAVDGGTEP